MDHSAGDLVIETGRSRRRRLLVIRGTRVSGEVVMPGVGSITIRGEGDGEGE